MKKISLSQSLVGDMNLVRSTVVLVLFLAVAVNVTASSSVLVQCSNATVYNDTSMCWRQGSSVVYNNLEDGMKEANRLGTSLLVENVSSCIYDGRLESERYTCNDRTTSPAMAEFNASLIGDNDSSSDQDTERTLDIFTFQTSTCPPGFIATDDEINRSSHANQTSCKCLEDIRGIVKCIDVRGYAAAVIHRSYCMAHDKDSRSIHIASCMTSCPGIRSLLDRGTHFYILPEDISKLDTTMCGKLNRQGFLCSECLPGYKPPAYSYSPKCVPCDLSRAELARNWMKYLGLAVLPQSVLFLLMVVFRVSVTRPPFISMIHVFQAIAIPQYMEELTRLIECKTYSSHYSGLVVVVHVGMTIYGFFNLDFFRDIGQKFCLDLDMTQLLLLEYATAFWPLFLIIGVYLLIKLHVRGCKLVVWVWKPIQYCLRHFQREWHLQSSLIETFASFLFLSWLKLLSISSRLLEPVCVYTVTSDGNISIDCSHMYISPNIKLFSREHLLFGIVTIFVMIVFLFIPLLLLFLYPLRVFHRLLNWCGFRFQALHVFMDSFQGSLQNGTNGTTDCRWFASSYLIVRIFAIILAALCDGRYFFPLGSVLLIGIAIGIYTVQPYKKSIHNTFEITLVLLLAAFYVSHTAVIVAEFASIDGYIVPSVVVTIALGFLPMVFSLSYAVWWIVKLKLSGGQLWPGIRQWWQQIRAEFEESVPDRLNNPQDYEEMELASLSYEEYF